jgi:hypothetical protein
MASTADTARRSHRAFFPAAPVTKCTCPSWFNCPERGCYELAKERYADVMMDRDRTFELRPEHDQDIFGRPLREGK